MSKKIDFESSKEYYRCLSHCIYCLADVVHQDTEQLRNESIACLRAKAQQHQLQLSLQPTTAPPPSGSYPSAPQSSTLHATV